MSLPATDIADFDSQIAELLNELSDVQRELLATLSEKRAMLVTADLAGLAKLQPRESTLIDRLQACQHRRNDLLDQASDNGDTFGSLTDLSRALPAASLQKWKPQLQDAAARSRLLRHQSLTNWVLVQRTLIHLSQMLEIIATGGRLCPTYGKGVIADTSGNLVDQEA